MKDADPDAKSGQYDDAKTKTVGNFQLAVSITVQN